MLSAGLVTTNGLQVTLQKLFEMGNYPGMLLLARQMPMQLRCVNLMHAEQLEHYLH